MYYSISISTYCIMYNRKIYKLIVKEVMITCMGRCLLCTYVLQCTYVQYIIHILWHKNLTVIKFYGLAKLCSKRLTDFNSMETMS